MNKVLKYLLGFIGALGTLATILGAYLQYTSSEKHKLEIKSVAEDKLTDLPTIDGLKGTYTYKDSIVNSLWKLNYIIANVGNEVIIGEGERTDLLKKNISFLLPKGFKILELKKGNSSLPYEYSFNGNVFTIHFLQWKSEEKFEISLYAEELNNNSIKPSLKVNEREIINCDVIYNSLQKDTIEKKAIGEYLPNYISLVVRWLGILLFGLMIIAAPFIFFSQLVQHLNYKKWNKIYLSKYNDWVSSLILDKKIAKKYSPKELPTNQWSNCPYPKPVIPADSLKNMSTIALTLVLIGGLVIIWMIKI